MDITSNRLNDDDDALVMAIDGTGIKVTNRGQWMQEKWNIKKRKVISKIHIAVNIKAKEILALEVTDGKVHDGKIMPKLIEQALENEDKDNVNIKSALGDGAYDSNENFKFLQKKRIRPGNQG